MNVVYTTGDDDLARVFVAELNDGAKIEFVESTQPPVPRKEKWVLIVSTLKGCPVGCAICDAGGKYKGKLSKEEIHAQIDFLIRRRFPDGRVPVSKLKIQFARMGDPAFNPSVLQVLEELPTRFELPGLIPSISTVAPKGCDDFLKALVKIKNEHYSAGRFQMQFSLHTTDARARRRLIPIHTLSLEDIAAWGDRFFVSGDRKITLNFAATKGFPLNPEELTPLFSAERFLIKLTPVNPTRAAMRAGLEGLIDPAEESTCRGIADQFRSAGFETILSIGELEENSIGSNCGMYVSQLEAEERTEACA